MDFRNDINFGNSSCTSRSDSATTRPSNDFDYGYPNDHSLPTGFGGDAQRNESLARCNGSSQGRSDSSSGYGFNATPSVSYFGCRSWDAQNYGQVSSVGRCRGPRPASPSSGSCGYGRSRSVTTRQDCHAGSGYCSKNSSITSRRGSPACSPRDKDGELNHCVDQILGPPPGWQGPCSTADVRECGPSRHQLDQRCFKSYNYILPAGARNPAQTPLARPYGLRPRWSCCRRAMNTGADLSHTPPPDHLVQACEMPVGIHFGDDGGRRFPNDIHLCHVEQCTQLETGR